jgi:hypothetical protein
MGAVEGLGVRVALDQNALDTCVARLLKRVGQECATDACADQVGLDEQRDLLRRVGKVEDGETEQALVELGDRPPRRRPDGSGCGKRRRSRVYFSPTLTRPDS